MLHYTEQNAVYTRAQNEESRNFVRQILTFEKTYYKKQAYGGKHITYQKTLVTSDAVFLTGFKTRIKDKAKLLNKKIKWTSPNYERKKLPLIDPRLKDIEFRKGQLALILSAIEKKRGVLTAPARYGKTITAAGIIASLKDVKALFLCHTKDLFYQTFEEFTKVGLFPISLIGDGRKGEISPLTIALHQSFIRIDPLQYSAYFDLVIVDECHHVASLNSNYGSILSRMLAPYRIGFTATPPTDIESELSLEGLLGPSIGEVTQEEALKTQVISPAKIRIVKIPAQPYIKNFSSYHDAYLEGVVRNRIRNRRVMKTAQEYLEQNMTVLIIVRRVEHGFNLKDMFDKLLPQYEVPFLCGGLDAETQKEIRRLKNKIDQYRTVGEIKGQKSIQEVQKELDIYRDIEAKIKKGSIERHQYRKLLHERRIKCIIVTTIWNEGVNIPSLNVLINAAGGKSETTTIQSASRCLTAFEGKEHGIIVDFFDNNARWFVDHFGERLSIYCDKGWI